MARNERVIYQCDVCGKKAEAQRVTGENRNVFYVRPDGWGHLFATAQKDTEKIQKKVDFCSEKCLVQVYEEWYSEAYD